MLRKSEVEQLAYEIARDRGDQCECNATYHHHIHVWGRCRGGVEIGAWDAWQRGWQAGRRISATPSRRG